MNAYEQGFIMRCKEYGIDPSVLIKKASTLPNPIGSLGQNIAAVGDWIHGREPGFSNGVSMNASRYSTFENGKEQTHSYINAQPTTIVDSIRGRVNQAMFNNIINSNPSLTTDQVDSLQDKLRNPYGLSIDNKLVNSTGSANSPEYLAAQQAQQQQRQQAFNQ